MKLVVRKNNIAEQIFFKNPDRKNNGVTFCPGIRVWSSSIRPGFKFYYLGNGNIPQTCFTNFRILDRIWFKMFLNTNSIFDKIIWRKLKNRHFKILRFVPLFFMDIFILYFLLLLLKNLNFKNEKVSQYTVCKTFFFHHDF